MLLADRTSCTAASSLPCWGRKSVFSSTHSLIAPLANQLVRAFASPQQNRERKEALPGFFGRLSGLGAESLLSRLHDRPTRRIRFLPLGSTHQHALATSAPDLPSPDFVCLLWHPSLRRTCKFPKPHGIHTSSGNVRWAVQLPWMPRTASHLNHDKAQAYTLRSLKVALLSAAAQLCLPEESRRQQGHRLTSVQLYSRDDAIESLWVQSQIASALIRGWRPTRPQSRGGQHAVFEPAFSVGAGPIPFWHTLSAWRARRSPPAGCVAFSKCFATHLPFAKQCICLTPKH